MLQMERITSRKNGYIAYLRRLASEGALRRERGETVTLRWILVHMIEEYARHCGHADLIRESGKKGKPNYFAPKRSNLYTDGVIPPKHESGK